MKKFVYILFIIFFIGGYFTYSLINKKEIITITKTEKVYDTVIHTISNTNTKVIKGDIIYKEITSIIDTNLILKDYFALHPVFRQWKDTNISISLWDTITKGDISNSKLTYQILKPALINMVSTGISKNSGWYLGLNLSTNLKFSDLNISYQRNKFIYEVGYLPAQSTLTFGFKYKIK